MLDKQQMFDTVVKHLLAQGERSVAIINYENRCMYRFEGLKCAVGCLIPDDLYIPEMEGLNVAGLLDKYPALKESIPHQNLALELQYVHDEVPVDKWRGELVRIAVKCGVNSKCVS